MIKNILMEIMGEKKCVNQFNFFLLVQQFIYSSFMIYDFVQKEGYCIIYGLNTNLSCVNQFNFFLLVQQFIY